MGARIEAEYGAMTPILAPAAVPAATVPAIAAPVALSGEMMAAEGGSEEGEVAPWPSSAEESAYLSGAAEGAGGPAMSAAATAAAPEEKAGPLPSLEELVERVPAPVREALDDLFRAQFKSVRRI